MYRRGREADPIRSGERGGSFPSGGNTVKVTRKCVKSLSAPFKNASGPFMRQRLCSNSGHHRATIEALAIKSSRGTRSVYTDRFEYVALQSRMCKRGGCGRAVRQSRFSFRKSNEANFGELVRGCIYIRAPSWILGERRLSMEF